MEPNIPPTKNEANKNANNSVTLEITIFSGILPKPDNIVNDITALTPLVKKRI